MPEQIGLKSSFYMPKHTHADNNNGGILIGWAALANNSVNLGTSGNYYIGYPSESFNLFNFFYKTFSGVKTSNQTYTSLWTFTARANIYFTIEFNAIMDPGVDTGNACIRDGTTIISPEYSFNQDGIIQKFTWTNYYEIGKTYNIALKSNTAGVYANLNNVKFYGYYNTTNGANYLYQYCVSPPAPALTS
jgi:hypothetical protein